MDFEKKKTTKELVYGMMAYNAASILGPLLFFGGLGFWLDTVFDSKPFILLVGIFVAFIATNIMMFRKIKSVSIMFDKAKNEKEENNK